MGFTVSPLPGRIFGGYTGVSLGSHRPSPTSERLTQGSWTLIIAHERLPMPGASYQEGPGIIRYAFCKLDANGDVMAMSAHDFFAARASGFEEEGVEQPEPLWDAGMATLVRGHTNGTEEHFRSTRNSTWATMREGRSGEDHASC